MLKDIVMQQRDKNLSSYYGVGSGGGAPSCSKTISTKSSSYLAYCRNGASLAKQQGTPLLRYAQSVAELTNDDLTMHDEEEDNLLHASNGTQTCFEEIDLA